MSIAATEAPVSVSESRAAALSVDERRRISARLGAGLAGTGS